MDALAEVASAYCKRLTATLVILRRSLQQTIIRMNRFVFSLLLSVAGIVHADGFAANRAKVLALGKLTIAPAMSNTPNPMKETRKFPSLNSTA